MLGCKENNHIISVCCPFSQKSLISLKKKDSGNMTSSLCCYPSFQAPFLKPHTPQSVTSVCNYRCPININVWSHKKIRYTLKRHFKTHIFMAVHFILLICGDVQVNIFDSFFLALGKHLRLSYFIFLINTFFNMKLKYLSTN